MNGSRRSAYSGRATAVRAAWYFGMTALCFRSLLNAGIADVGMPLGVGCFGSVVSIISSLMSPSRYAVAKKIAVSAS